MKTLRRNIFVSNTNAAELITSNVTNVGNDRDKDRSQKYTRVKPKFRHQELKIKSYQPMSDSGGRPFTFNFLSVFWTRFKVYKNVIIVARKHYLSALRRIGTTNPYRYFRNKLQ